PIKYQMDTVDTNLNKPIFQELVNNQLITFKFYKRLDYSLGLTYKSPSIQKYITHISNHEVYNGAAYIMYQNGNPLQSVKKILFFDSYCKVLYQNNRHDCFLSESVSLEKEVLSNSNVQQCWNYITELSNKTGRSEEHTSELQS